MIYMNRDMACKAYLQESRPTLALADKLAAVGAIAFVALFLGAIWLS